MPTAPDHKIFSILPPNVSEDNKTEFLELCYFLKTTHEITPEQEWPFRSLITHHKIMNPETHKDSASLPNTVKTLSYDDIKTVTITKHWLDFAANTMSEDDIRKNPIFWTEILYTYFLTFCGCETARTKSRQAVRTMVINAIYELLPSSSDK